jgi:hypothetical protein
LSPIRAWREELYAWRSPPFDTGSDTLFVAYSAWAEMTCFKVLGWRFPVHIFDQHTAYLAASNLLLPYDPDEKRAKPRKALPDACRAYAYATIHNGTGRFPSLTSYSKSATTTWVKFLLMILLAYRQPTAPGRDDRHPRSCGLRRSSQSALRATAKATWAREKRWGFEPHQPCTTRCPVLSD